MNLYIFLHVCYTSWAASELASFNPHCPHWQSCLIFCPQPSHPGSHTFPQQIDGFEGTITISHLLVQPIHRYNCSPLTRFVICPIVFQFPQWCFQGSIPGPSSLSSLLCNWWWACSDEMCVWELHCVPCSLCPWTSLSVAWQFGFHQKPHFISAHTVTCLSGCNCHTSPILDHTFSHTLPPSCLSFWLTLDQDGRPLLGVVPLPFWVISLSLGGLTLPITVPHCDGGFLVPLRTLNPLVRVRVQLTDKKPRG